MKPKTKAKKVDQISGELAGELAAYDKVGLFQHSVSTKTAYRYRGVLLQYQKVLQGQSPSLSLSGQFLAHLRKQGYSASTLRLYRAALQGFHSWRGEQLVFAVKVPRRQPKYVEPEIIDKILVLSQDSPTDQLILRLMTDAGLRRGEVIRLKVKQVGEDALRFSGKGAKERTVPLTSALKEALKLHLLGKSPNDLVVGLKDKGIYNVVKKYGKLVGMPDLRPHDLRHSFAERLIEAGASIRTVQELLGHESLDTTQVYIGVTANHLREAVLLLEKHGEKPKASITDGTQPSPEHFKHRDSLTEICDLLASTLKTYRGRSDIGIYVDDGITIKPRRDGTYSPILWIDPRSAKCISAHYQHRFGELPFALRAKLTGGDIDDTLIDNIYVLSHIRDFQPSPTCPECQRLGLSN